MWQRGAVPEPLCWWRLSAAVAIIPVTPALINDLDSYLDEAWGHSGVAVDGEWRPWPCRNWYQYTHVWCGCLKVCFFFFNLWWVMVWKAAGFNAAGRCEIAAVSLVRSWKIFVFDRLQPKNTISKECHHIWNWHFGFAVVPNDPQKKDEKNSSTIVFQQWSVSPTWQRLYQMDTKSLWLAKHQHIDFN